MRRSAPRALSGSQSGFTLIEIIAVLFIIGIVVTFATLSGSGRVVDDRVEEEARRLSRVLQLAMEESLIHGVELGLVVYEDGYRLVVLDQGKWIDYGAETPLRPRVIPAPMVLKMIVDGYDSPLVPESETPTDEEETVSPQAYFLSSGESTPFILEIGVQDTRSRFRIEGDVVGRIRMDRVAES